MASPQREQGHLDVANELAEALALAALSGAQFRLLWVLLRKTYGWNKRTDMISVSQFSAATGLHRKVVERELRDLSRRRFLLAWGDNHHPKTFALQKDYEQWDDGEVGTKMLTLRRDGGSDTVPTQEISGNQNAPKWEPNGSKVGTETLTTITTSTNTTTQQPGETESHDSAASGTLRDRFESEYRDATNKNGIVGKYFQLLLGQKPDIGRLGGMRKRLNSGGRLFDVMLAISKQHITDDAHDYLEKAVQRELRGEGATIPADDGVPLSKRMSGNVRRLQGADW